MEYITLVGFNGINRNVSSFVTQVGDLSDAQNISTPKIGVLQKSFDYTIKGAQIVDNYSIMSGHDWYRQSGTHEHYISVDGASNAEIYKYVTDTWTSQSQSLTAGNKVRFASVPAIDKLFAVNYADATRSFDGTTWSTSTDVTDAAKGKVIMHFANRLFILNAVSGATSYPDRMYMSDLIESSVAWNTANWYTFGDVVVGAGFVGDKMFIGCDDSTHIFTKQLNQSKMSDIGCVSHESIVSYGSWVFYASNDGYYVFDGTDTVKISLPVDDFWKGIPQANYKNIQAARKNERIYVYIGDVTSPDDSSETLQNVILEYNILQNNWNKGSLKSGCTNLHRYVTTTGNQLFMGDDDGNVYQMFDGSGQQNGSDYASYIETNWLYGSGAGFKDTWYEVMGFGTSLSGLKVAYKTDNESDWNECKELVGYADVVKIPKVRSYKIKLRLSEFSGNNLYSLERIDLGYEPEYPIEDEN